jgi:hypothetical protein
MAAIVGHALDISLHDLARDDRTGLIQFGPAFWRAQRVADRFDCLMYRGH